MSTSTHLTAPGFGSGALMTRIVLAGLAGGAVDFIYASTRGAMMGRPVGWVWQSVASGWLGVSAFSAGPSSVALGLATHFGIATTMAAAFVLLVTSVPRLAREPYVAPLYGLALYVVMYLIVLPLRWPQLFPRWDGWGSVADVLAHIGVAVAIAWVANRPASTASAD